MTSPSFAFVGTNLNEARRFVAVEVTAVYMVDLMAARFELLFITQAFVDTYRIPVIFPHDIRFDACRHDDGIYSDILNPTFFQ